MKTYNTRFVNIELKDETEVRLFAENEYYEMILIGSFDFYWSEGYIVDVNGKRKEVKRFSTIMNTLFKQNENLFWDAVTPETAKQNAKQQKKDEAKQYELQLKEADEKKASDMIEGIKNKEEKYINICKNVENKTDDELLELTQRSFKRASKKVVMAVFNTIKDFNNGILEVATVETVNAEETTNNEVVVTEVVTQDNEQPEVYYLNKNVFYTYSEAFNHAVQNGITTTKIVSSKHPTMTTDRLQELEYSYVFDKMQMTYDDMKEYYDYLESIPNSLDRENRYYKLKGWIERYEAQQQRQQAEKDRLHGLALEASQKLEYMQSKGLEIVEHETMVKYKLNGQDVHTWISGISTEQYHDGIMTVYHNYFS